MLNLNVLTKLVFRADRRTPTSHCHAIKVKAVTQLHLALHFAIHNKTLCSGTRLEYTALARNVRRVMDRIFLLYSFSSLLTLLIVH